MLMLQEHVTSSLEVVAASLAPPAVKNVNNNILLLRWTWAGGGSPLTHLSNCLAHLLQEESQTHQTLILNYVCHFFLGGGHLAWVPWSVIMLARSRGA